VKDAEIDLDRLKDEGHVSRGHPDRECGHRSSSEGSWFCKVAKLEG
jgi:hypothetical protein